MNNPQNKINKQTKKSKESGSTYFLQKYSSLILISISFLLYCQTIKFDYTNLDDKTLLADNKEFISKLSSIPQAFEQGVFKDENQTFYRPILVTSFIIDGSTGNMSINYFHFINILLHIIAVCLLLRFLIKLKIDPKTSLLLSLLFAVHPALTQAVAWIPGRNDSLLAIFTLASFLSLFRYSENKKSIHLVLHICFFLLAILTKETAVILPILYVLIARFLYNENIFSKKNIISGSFWVFSIFIWYALRSNAIQLSEASRPVQLTDNLSSNLPALILYIGKILLPVNLSVMPVMNDNTLMFGFATLFIFVLIFILLKIKLSSPIIIGLTWFILFISPILLLPKEFAFYYEHRLYLPLVGILILLGHMQLNLQQNYKSASKIFNTSLLTLIIIFSGISFTYSRNFKDKFSFWESAIEKSPSAVYINKVLAGIYNEENMPDEAEKYYLEALKLNPKEPAIRNDLGTIYNTRKEHEKALTFLEEEYKISPHLYQVSYNLAYTYYLLKRLPEAEKYMLKVVELNPNYHEAYFYLTIINADMNNFPKAKLYAQESEKNGVKIPDELWNKIGR